MIEGKIPKSVFASYLIRIILNEDVPPKLIYHFFQSKNYWNQIQSGAAGIGQPNVNASKLAEINIPLPPLPEQRRIVAKLDTVLAKVDSARARMERLPGILQRFRQSVLAQAVSGKLTEEWRRENGGDWKQKNLDEVSEITGGLTKNPGRNEFSKTIPYLRVANVYANRLELEEIKEIGVLETELERVLLKKNDLLIVEGNGSIDQIGRVALWDASIEPCAHQNHLIKVRFPDSIEPSYILFYLLSHQGRQQIVKVSSSTSGLNTLSLSKVGKLTIQLPLLPEQKEIVRRVQELFAVADRLEERYEALSGKVEGLPQALLAKAFRGELVPQNPDDEPASVLLEKPEKEKSMSETTSKKTKTKGRSRKEKSINMKDSQNNSIEEVLLPQKGKPMKASDVWKQSKFSESIDKFYEELRFLVEVEKKVEAFIDYDKESYLKLVK